jgi:hypothetical protein
MGVHSRRGKLANASRKEALAARSVRFGAQAGGSAPGARELVEAVGDKVVVGASCTQVDNRKVVKPPREGWAIPGRGKLEGTQSRNGCGTK